MEGAWDRRQHGLFAEMQRGQLSGVDQKREQVIQVRKKKRQGMYRSLNLDPRAKESSFYLSHDLIKFKALASCRMKKSCSQIT